MLRTRYITSYVCTLGCSSVLGSSETHRARELARDGQVSDQLWLHIYILINIFYSLNTNKFTNTQHVKEYNVHTQFHVQNRFPRMTCFRPFIRRTSIKLDSTDMKPFTYTIQHQINGFSVSSLIVFKLNWIGLVSFDQNFHWRTNIKV